MRGIDFSLTDLGRVLKRGRSLILVFGLLCGCLAFFYFVSRPISYTAEGLFKGASTQAQSSIFKALELFGKEDVGSSEDARSFLHSYPVLKNVVQSLHLQGTVVEPSWGGRFKNVWYNLKCSFSCFRLKKRPPASPILRRGILTPDHLIVPDALPTLQLTQLDYPAEMATYFTLHFLNDHTFQVKEKGHFIGEGELNRPFLWHQGSFTLTGFAHEGKKVGLSLLPLKQIVQSLEKSLDLKRDKENASLIHIRYTLGDRHLATAIVNEVMEQFQEYLTQDGKRKITKQLAYLHQRQEETLDQFDSVLQKQKNYLADHLDAGLILSLEKELEFMADTQAQRRQTLIAIQAEMQHLAPQKSWPECLSEYAGKVHRGHALSVESAHDMIHYHQKELDQLCLDHERYEDCILKLSEPRFDCSSLSKILSDPSLTSRFEKMDLLHHRLVDEKNWSAKEREQFKSELETEKAFMVAHTQLLKEGIWVHMQSIQKRIETLHEDLLYLLADRFLQEENALAVLSASVSNFPEKWVSEQKITLSSKMYKEIMESITKMIEAKNLGYNLDYLNSQIIQPASPPVLPNLKPLLLGSLVGLSGGFFLIIFVLALFTIWKGPTASYSNLRSAQRRVLPSKETIPLLSLALQSEGKVILLTSKKEITVAAELIDWLKRKGDAIEVIDSRSRSFKDPAYLASATFQQELQNLKKSSSRLLLLSVGPIEGFETQALLQQADIVIYEVTDETIRELKGLPDTSFFIIRPFKEPPLLTLEAVIPKLENLLQQKKLSSFSSVKSAWERLFLLKRT